MSAEPDITGKRRKDPYHTIVRVLAPLVALPVLTIGCFLVWWCFANTELVSDLRRFLYGVLGVLALGASLLLLRVVWGLRVNRGEGVILLAGLAAAIAGLQLFVSEWAESYRRAHAASVRADLANLRTAMEEYHAAHGWYTDDVGELDFQSTPNVGLPVITLRAPGDGWSAAAAHEVHPDVACTIRVGAAAAVAGVEDGRPQCDS